MKLVVRECICLVSIPRELESLLHCVCPILAFRAVPICPTTDLSLVGGIPKVRGMKAPRNMNCNHPITSKANEKQR